LLSIGQTVGAQETPQIDAFLDYINLQDGNISRGADGKGFLGRPKKVMSLSPRHHHLPIPQGCNLCNRRTPY